MAAGSPESSLLRGDRRIFKPASQEACSIKQDASAAFSQTNLLAAGQGPATRACFLKQPNGNFLIKIYIYIYFFLKPCRGKVKGKPTGRATRCILQENEAQHGTGTFGIHRGPQSLKHEGAPSTSQGNRVPTAQLQEANGLRARGRGLPPLSLWPRGLLRREDARPPRANLGDLEKPPQGALGSFASCCSSEQSQTSLQLESPVAALQMLLKSVPPGLSVMAAKPQ